MKSRLLGAVCACVFTLSLTTTANAALVGRDLDGNSATAEAYYDDQLDVTWAADANISGTDNWETQIAWAASLTINGVGGWRLPSADVNGDSIVDDCFGTQTACKDNEILHLNVYGGGTTQFGDIITADSPGPFINIQSSSNYWTGTEQADPLLTPNHAWFINFNGAGVFDWRDLKSNSLSAWAVQSGDIGAAVSAVPVPAAVWLFGSGLLGLVGMARRRKVA